MAQAASITLLLLVLLAPLPASLALAALLRDGVGRAAHGLRILSLYVLLQMGLGLALGGLGALDPSGLLLGSVGLLLGGGLLLWRRGGGVAWTEWLEGWDRVPRRMLALIAAAGALALGWGVTHPVENFDSLFYHLPQIATWFQDGRLTVLEHLGPPARYPFGWELLCALLVIPLREDLLVTAPNLLAWAMLGLGTFALGRRWGASRVAALGAAGLLLTTPEILLRTHAVQVDLLVAAAFLLGLGAALERVARPVTLLWLLLALALAAAVKSSGWLYGFLPLAIFLVRMSWIPREGEGRHWLVATLVGVGVVLSIAGPWYLRNWVELGNPLGLLRVEWAGKVLFPGTLDPDMLRDTSLARFFRADDRDHWEVLGVVLRDRLGWRALALPLALGAWVADRRRNSPERWSTVLGLGVLGLLLVLYWHSPYGATNGNQGGRLTPWMANGLRYGFGALALAWALVAAASRSIPGATLAWAVAVPVGTVLGLREAQAGPLAPVLLLLAVLAIAGLALALRRRPRAARVGALGGVLLLFSVLAVLPGSAMRERRRADAYGELAAFVEEGIAPGTTIGCSSPRASYVLFGRQLDRRVRYLPRELSTPEEWWELLESSGIEIVAVGPLPPRALPALQRRRRWAVQHPERLELLWGTNVQRTPMLYRFHPTPR